jgi:acyl-CoA thioesterase
MEEAVIADRRIYSSRLGAIDPTWRSWDGVHGGYALALTAKLADADAAGAPRALHGTFLLPIPAEEGLDVSLTDLRRGRSSADMRAEVYAGSRRVLEVVSTFDRGRTGPHFERFPCPEVPQPETCEEFALPVELVPFTSHIEVRPTTESRPLAGGHDPELAAWIRLKDGDLEPWQVVTVLLDALPPAFYAIATAPAAIPTTMLSVALADAAHDCDPSDWAFVRIRADFAAGGWVVETSTVWNQSGDLLGYASQQRKVLSALH